MAKVIVAKGKARPFWYGHPWVFSGAVDRVNGQAAEGDVVEVLDAEGRTIGRGFFEPRSPIRVRMVTLGGELDVDRDLVTRRIHDAVRLRHATLGLDRAANAYRLVHSDGDFLPGLVADRVGRWVVIQISTRGMARFKDAALDALSEALNPAGIYERAADAPEPGETAAKEGVLRGEEPPPKVEIVEHGVRFVCDVKGGQKTGFYSDQRDNRQLVTSLARGKTLLDAFSYSAAFAIHALKRGGAASAVAVDSSEKALELAKESAALNGVRGLTLENRNVLRYLDETRKAGQGFDLVVLDPPKLVKKMADLRKGLRTYFEINEKALGVVKPDGLLVTCSCSQHVDEARFEDMLSGAAKGSGRRIQVLFRLSQGPDHPVALPLAESRYLKAYVCRVV